MVIGFLFVISLRDFAVEYFGIRHWKANENKNLMIISEIKIERQQPEKSQNMFERIQKNEEKPSFSTFRFFSLYLREFLL